MGKDAEWLARVGLVVALIVLILGYLENNGSVIIGASIITAATIIATAINGHKS